MATMLSMLGVTACMTVLLWSSFCLQTTVLAVQDPEHLFEDLVNIEMVAMLNEAFCKLHHKPYCPPSEELTKECGKVRFLTFIKISFIIHGMGGKWNS